jgi:polyhydroxybutyrate depolymerase
MNRSARIVSVSLFLILSLFLVACVNEIPPLVTASTVVGGETATPSDHAALVDEDSTADTIEFAAYEDGIEPRPSDGCGTIPTDTNNPNDGIDMQVGELNRQYYLYLPPGYDPETPTSLVLSFHGYNGNAISQQYGIGMNAQADKYGFIIAYPEATSFSTSSENISSWNDLTCNASPGPEGPICAADAYKYAFPPECGEPTDCNWCTCHDDLAFIEQILDELEQNFCIDRNRIYATGMSNGGMFVHRLGCDMADRFAAIVPVSGTLAKGFNCVPDNATQISIMNIHGTQDDYVDVTGAVSSDGYLYTAVSDVMEAWSAPESQGCDPDITPYPTVADGMRGMTCTQNTNCETGAEVVSCWWDAGHDWPTGNNQFGNEMIWDFFRKNAKQE